MRKKLTLVPALVALGAFSLALTSFTVAQEAAPKSTEATPRSAAPTEEAVVGPPELRPIRDLRDIIRNNSPTDSVASAKAELEARAPTEAAAAITLGELYIRGTEATPLNYAAGLSLLEQAGTLGDTDALQRLGALHRNGGNSALDPSKAAGYYQRAADLGDAASAQIVGDMYRRGTDGLPVNTNEAVHYYEVAVAAGDTRSLMRLGDVYRAGAGQGLDPARAIEYYTVAAEQNNGRAYYALADIYRTSIPVQPELAIANYKKSYEAGFKPAIVALGLAYLDGELGTNRAAEGIAALELGVAASVEDAALELARTYLSGRGVPADPARGLALMEGAVSSGDVRIARNLIRLYTAGAAGVTTNVAAAQSVLQRIGPMLTDGQRQFETLIILAASASSTQQFSALPAIFNSLEAADKLAVLPRVYELNRNAYVYLLQNHLASTGHYTGALNGLMTSSTITAINRVCIEQGISDICRRGPLSSSARRTLPTVIF